MAGHFPDAVIRRLPGYYRHLRELEAMCEKYHCYLPPFCHFTPEEWEEKGVEYDEIRDNKLGWDITDYGLGDFDKIGFSLITIRNGNQKNPKYKNKQKNPKNLLKTIKNKCCNLWIIMLNYRK